MSDTSLGISESGVLVVLGGVAMKPGITPPLRGKGGALAGFGNCGSMPAARNLSSRELGSGVEVEDGGTAGVGWLKEGWACDGSGDRTTGGN